MAITFGDNSLTIRQLWEYTYKYVESRFDYRDRDVLKRIKVQEVKSYSKDRRNQPLVRYDIVSYSYPQYDPYGKVKGRLSKKQRKVKHQYSSTIQLENLTWNSKIRYRLGSQKKWPEDKKIKWKEVKAIHSSIREKYYKKYGKGTKEYNEAIKKHKKKARYLDKGDYISQVFGINGDFYWRIQGNLYLRGMLFGIAWEKDMYDEGIPFLDKHSLRVIEVLLRRKVIKKT
jgi:hypothetical protein